MTIKYIPENEAHKSGYYLWIPQWASYDTRPKKISPFLFTVLSLLPFFTTNPFNGYLIFKTKWFDEKDMSDFIHNPHEKTDILLARKLGFMNEWRKINNL